MMHTYILLCKIGIKSVQIMYIQYVYNEIFETFHRYCSPISDILD